MAFIDDLSLVLDLLILVTATVFYTGALVYFEYRRKDSARAYTHLRGGAALLGLLGGLIGFFALWGEILWPLPGAYDVFFFDVLILLALLLVAFAVCVRMRLPTHLVGMLGVIIGLGVLFYGFRAYQLSLTKDPFETLLMYSAFGAVSIGTYPVTLFVDWFVIGPSVPGADPLPSAPTPAYPKMWLVFLSLFMLGVLLAGLAAVFYGISTTWGHLGSPP
jgi:putative membrane protein